MGFGRKTKFLFGLLALVALCAEGAPGERNLIKRSANYMGDLYNYDDYAQNQYTLMDEEIHHDDDIYTQDDYTPINERFAYEEYHEDEYGDIGNEADDVFSSYTDFEEQYDEEYDDMYSDTPDAGGCAIKPHPQTLFEQKHVSSKLATFDNAIDKSCERNQMIYNGNMGEWDKYRSAINTVLFKYKHQSDMLPTVADSCEARTLDVYQCTQVPINSANKDACVKSKPKCRSCKDSYANYKPVEFRVQIAKKSGHLHKEILFKDNAGKWHEIKETKNQIDGKKSC